jgi:hypothetical protein
MGNVLGTILSLALFIPSFLFGADLIVIQNSLTKLEAVAATISYRISQKGKIDQEIVDYVRSESLDIVCVENCSATPIGEVITYRLLKSYKPLFISKDEINIVITRTTMVGYY